MIVVLGNFPYNKYPGAHQHLRPRKYKLYVDVRAGGCKRLGAMD